VIRFSDASININDDKVASVARLKEKEFFRDVQLT
jgi:hypothetical protein